MKYVSAELTGKKLSFTLCDTASGAPGEIYTVALPKAAQGSAFAAPEQTARFLADRLKERRLKRYPVSLILDSEQVNSVAFSHYPAPPEKMRGLAELYSESALPASSGYYIAYSARDYVHTDGQNRSVLYAAAGEHVKRLYRAMKKAGVNVYAIESSGAAFSRLVLERAVKTGSEADIYIDFGESSSLVSVCRGGQIVFEQSFTSIYQDIIDTYADTTGGTAGEAADFIGKAGLNPGADVYGKYPELLRKMNVLVDVTLDEIFRTLRIAFSGERLEAGGLIISGDFTAMPGFTDRVAADSAGLVPEGKTSVSKVSRLLGARGPKKESTENLLYIYYKKQRRSATTALVACIVVLLAATIFPIQFIYYNMQKSEYNDLTAQLQGGQYAEIKSLLSGRQSLESLKTQLEAAFEKIPTENPSRAGEIIDTLYNQFKTYAQAVYINMNNQTGALEIDFTTDSLQSYLDLKTALENTGLFTSAIPFSCSFNADGACSGHMSLAMADFTPFEPDKPAPAQTTAADNNG